MAGQEIHQIQFEFQPQFLIESAITVAALYFGISWLMSEKEEPYVNPIFRKYQSAHALQFAFENGHTEVAEFLLKGE